jgi:hypothetical protein
VRDPTTDDLNYILREFIIPQLDSLREKKIPDHFARMYKRPYSILKTFVHNVIPLFLMKYFLGGNYMYHPGITIYRFPSCQRFHRKSSNQFIQKTYSSAPPRKKEAMVLWHSVASVNLAVWLTKPPSENPCRRYIPPLPLGWTSRSFGSRFERGHQQHSPLS